MCSARCLWCSCPISLSISLAGASAAPLVTPSSTSQAPHELQTAFTFWYLNKKKASGAVADQSYEENIKKMATFRTVRADQRRARQADTLHAGPQVRLSTRDSSLTHDRLLVYAPPLLLVSALVCV